MNIVNEIESLLNAEYRLLKQGTLNGLSELLERKTMLASKMTSESFEVSEETLRQLRSRAKRNEALLESAQRGLQAAIVQIRQSTRAIEQSTYSKSGKKQNLARTPNAVAKKW